ncbi:cyclic nucleotide-binding domain-containing protein 2 [Notechis scutatus]|uniref:Cyclic nucleotide-binding domain-containing protein 2 n=1 Tax=Notechis scutatus TaxID=8663 RepID=A0A6J1VB45_9SAUR|nr:cyclic nucleotide-binding domain-containing protein 2 [Notechis scutatus]
MPVLFQPHLEAGYRDKLVNYKRGIKNFRRLIVNIILMIKACRGFRSALKGFAGFDLIEKDCRRQIEGDIKSANIVFDRHEFSVSKEHFPFRAIQITKKPPTWRTESEIKHLRNRLQLLESFRQYSPTLQYLLAKVIRFERFGRRRVVIKKGHEATAFYFIYYGTVAITDDDDGSSAFVETAPTTIQRGASFGEIALLQKTKRIATVVCMEETELLVVDKKDFFAYKLDKELQREFKVRYDYLRAIDLFQTLPDSSIDKIANYCKVERFYCGQVITTDLAETHSMVFITKGICEVLRLVNLSTCPSYQKWIIKQLHFPKNKISTKERYHMNSGMLHVDFFKGVILDILCVSRHDREGCQDHHQPIYCWYLQCLSEFRGHVIKRLVAPTRFGICPCDDELCQIFLRQNAWEMFKKDLLKLVMEPKLMKMVHPPHPCPTAEVYDSWSLNQEGILDLSSLCYRIPRPPPKLKYVPIQLTQTRESLPVVLPKLIHGISVVRPNLDGAF